MEEVVAVVVEAEECGENRYKRFFKKSSIYFVSNISFHGLCPFQECALRISFCYKFFRSLNSRKKRWFYHNNFFTSGKHMNYFS